MAYPGKPYCVKNVCIFNDDIGREWCSDSHQYCKYINWNIEECIKNNKVITPKLITRYFTIVCHNMLCWSYSYQQHLKICDHIIKNYDFHKFPIISDMICKSSENMEVIDMIIESMVIDKDVNYLDLYNSGGKNNFKLLFEKLSKKFVNANNHIVDMLNLALNKGCYEALNNILDSKITFNDIGLFHLLLLKLYKSNYPDSVSIIKKCILSGCTIKPDTIYKLLNDIKNYNTYSTGLLQIIMFLYENGSTKIKINDFLDRKIHSALTSKDYNNIINYLIDNNIEITEEEFIKLCEYNVKVTNMNKINKFLSSKEVKKKIFESGIDYNIKFDFDIDMLKIECKKSNNINKIKEILKYVQPDQECLELVCEHSSTLNTVKLLHETYNLPFTDNCILNTAKHYGYNRVLGYVLNLYNGTNVNAVPIQIPNGNAVPMPIPNANESDED